MRPRVWVFVLAVIVAITAPMRAQDLVSWEDLLDGFDETETKYLPKKDDAALSTLIETWTERAERNGGKVSRAEWEKVGGALLEKGRAAKAEYRKIMATDWGRDALQIAIMDRDEVKNRLSAKAKFRTRYHPPYVILVQESEEWEEHAKAAEIAGYLAGVRAAFKAEVLDPLGRPEATKPVPVVVLASMQDYEVYCSAGGGKGMGQLAHYEPSNNRLVIHKSCDMSTVLHEGTHQLVRSTVRRPLPWGADAFWFNEGIAEWFGHARRVETKDGVIYETGLLDRNDVDPKNATYSGRLMTLEVLRQGRNPAWKDVRPFTLADLIRQTNDRKDAYSKEGIEGNARTLAVYSQGWFLIYFLNRFDVTKDGVVKFGAPGRYQEGWKKFLAATLDGAWNKDLFEKSLGLPPGGMTKVSEEFDLYTRFVWRKIRKGHVKDQRLVPWTDAVDKDGKAIGKPEDDLLRAPESKAAPKAPEKPTKKS